MKKFLFLLMSVACFSVYSQESSNQKVNEKYVFHQWETLNATSGEILKSFTVTGVIVDASINNKDFLSISIADVYTYNLTIVNKVIDYPQEDIKVVMYQGGETIEDRGTYTASVFFVYDLKKNEEVPEFVRFQIHNSPNVMVFSGIIKLNN